MSLKLLRHHPISECSASTPDRRRRPGSTPGPPAPILRCLGPVLRQSAPPRSPSRPGRRILEPGHALLLVTGTRVRMLRCDCPWRAAPRVRTPGLACCVAGWLPPGGRARSESILAPCSMLALAVSIERIDLRFSHLSHVADKH